MTKLKLLSVVCVIVMAYATSCTDEIKPAEKLNDDSYLTLIQQAGFSTIGARKMNDDYLVEGDILLEHDQLEEMAGGKAESANGRVNHYVTDYTVGPLPKTITVSVYYRSHSAPPNAASMITNIKAAIARYNALNLKLTFQYLDTYDAPATIKIELFSSNTDLGRVYSRFPYSDGSPGYDMHINTYTMGSRADAVSLICHGIGHNIGFKHTDINYTGTCDDYETGADELNGDGENLISNTNPDAAANSWMLACPSGTGVDRPFTSEDIEALERLYGNPKSSTGQEWWKGVYNYDGYTFNIADVTGDGLADAIGFNGSLERGMVWVNNGSGFSNAAQWIDGPYAFNGYTFRAADVTGDGKADIVGFSVSTERAMVWVSNGSGFNAGTQWIDGPYVFNNYTTLLGDVNGDGKADLVAVDPVDERAIVWKSTGTAFSSGAEWVNGNTNYQSYGFHLGDVNGDAKADLVGYNPADHKAVVWKSATTTFNAGATWFDGTVNWSGMIFGLADMNGDGLSDMINFGLSVEKAMFIPSATTSFGPEQQWIDGPFGYTPYYYYTGKMNADAKADMILIHPSSERFLVYISQ